MSICFVTPSGSIIQNQSFPDHYTIFEIKSHAATQLQYMVAIPHQSDPSLAPLVAIHGISRDARGMLSKITQRLTPSASQVIIAPIFDRNTWKGYQRVIDSCRADLALLSLLNTIETNQIADTGKIELFGYSGGAQFAHRFALLYPHLIKRLMLCSSGWYTFPDENEYPYGLSLPKKEMPGFNAFTRKNLTNFLRLEIEVYVGKNDTIVDANTRSGRKIDKQQGRNRLQRARNWVTALQSVARELGIQSKIGLHELEGCGHHLKDCIVKGDLVRHLFNNRLHIDLRYPHN